ncbi:hypothetical protein HHL17_01085 [Chitinophaga sp. G-6-1-13]|uniref:Uncharacterized protein n=1 Tax=Chitinophaga fulva TaxID=2728842 RepID=A0A848GDD4_9BACT|nr:hypothetical protein [Chitinophaga fulva]NML35777.1 hypothetical protein [Chitinophaga fulva]
MGISLVLGCLSCSQLADTFKDTFEEKSDEKKEEASGTTSHNSPVTSSVTIESRISRDTVHVTYSSRSTSRDTVRATYSSGSANRKLNFLTDETGLKAAEESLRALPAYAGKKMYLYDDIHAYDDGRINLQLRHPENPEYVDAYHFVNGKWNGPEPVQLSVRNKIENKLVPLDEIDFGSMARVYKNIVEKSATIEGAKPPTHIYGIVQEKHLLWYPASINGSRERYAISFHKDGSINKFFRE